MRAPLKLTPGAKRQSPEFGLQMAAASFLRAAMPPGIVWSHFPAGEARDARTGAKLRAMGLQKGWPDLCFVLPGGRAGFIELKAGNGSLTPEQKVFRDAVMKVGAAYAVCRTVPEVQAALGLWGVDLRGRIAA